MWCAYFSKNQNRNDEPWTKFLTIPDQWNGNIITMKLKAVLRTICVYHAISLVSGTSGSECCPSFYKLNKSNNCVSNVNAKDIENIREDFTTNCKGRLIQIDVYDTSETYYEGKI